MYVALQADLRFAIEDLGFGSRRFSFGPLKRVNHRLDLNLTQTPVPIPRSPLLRSGAEGLWPALTPLP